MIIYFYVKAIENLYSYYHCLKFRMERKCEFATLDSLIGSSILTQKLKGLFAVS